MRKAKSAKNAVVDDDADEEVVIRQAEDQNLIALASEARASTESSVFSRLWRYTVP